MDRVAQREGSYRTNTPHPEQILLNRLLPLDHLAGLGWLAPRLTAHGWLWLRRLWLDLVDLFWVAGTGRLARISIFVGVPWIA